MYTTFTYQYKELTWSDLVKLTHAVSDDAKHAFVPSEIRPFHNRPAFDDQWGVKPQKFEEMFKKYQGHIRKYAFTASRRFGPKNGRHSRIDFTVRISENLNPAAATDRYPSIELIRFDGDDYDFDRVRRVIEQALGLKFSEKQLKEDLLTRYRAAIRHPDLRKHVDAAMSAHQYDLAISGASILVESSLRSACLKHGCTAAAAATGADLAMHAFHATNGCMTPPYPVATQANHGAFILFQGFFLYLRNAYLHNAVVMGADRRYVVEFLCLCDTLLVIIDGSTKR